MNRFPITAAGYAALELELKHRIRVERPRFIQRIREAIADDTNLPENSEYQSAKTDQELNEFRIAELDTPVFQPDEISLHARLIEPFRSAVIECRVIGSL